MKVNSIETVLIQLTRSISSHRHALLACMFLSCLLGEAPPVLADDLPRTHVLVINGGASPRLNYQSHLLHVKRIYRIAREAGVPERNISILSADGSDPEPDLATRDLQEEASFWMLSGTRLERSLHPKMRYENSELAGAILLPATREGLQSWFDTAAAKLLPGDTLLLYVTDHGTLNDKDPSNNQITLWGKDENIDVEELQRLIDGLHPMVRVVALMSQCYSGSFANLMYGQPGEETTRGTIGGYFSSTADRPAYGCYPENREEYNVGHSFRFFDALEAGDNFKEAHENVLISDRTPDVPLRSSDLYLEAALSAEADSLGVDFDELVDRLLKSAWRDKKHWEAEIRLLDRMGEAFGYFSPRFLAELGQHSKALSEVSDQLNDYATAWKRALLSLNRENLARFTAHHPDWEYRLSGDELKGLNETERLALTRDLLIELAAFTEKDTETAARLRTLREKAEATREASYRAEVRGAVVLRMRYVLISIAGRQYLSERGADEQRVFYSKLMDTEAFALGETDRSRNRRVDVEAFPRFDEEIRLAESALPGWMGIQFRAVAPERRERYQLGPGAVRVLAVFPDSPALKTGLQAGDIIIGPPGKPFTERDLVREWVMTAPIGKAQSIQIQRGEEHLTLALTPEPYPREWPSLPGPPKAGSPAPSLGKLERFRGSPPEELTGHGPYLLFFWATWCGPCKAALPELIAFERERNTPVLSITDETAESVEAFLRDRESPFPEAIALDEYRSSFLAYGVSATPSFILVDAQGTVQTTQSGYRPSKGLMIDGWKWEKGKTPDSSAKP